MCQIFEKSGMLPSDISSYIDVKIEGVGLEKRSKTNRIIKDSRKRHGNIYIGFNEKRFVRNLHKKTHQTVS